MSDAKIHIATLEMITVLLAKLQDIETRLVRLETRNGTGSEK